ncbi:MAG: hypothetical protein N7Q72_02545, partial [Spiroplasma sp. Tabriz.8]|nr:hypothetical protein [Spiroplasma sp. Tabriz.8]
MFVLENKKEMKMYKYIYIYIYIFLRREEEENNIRDQFFNPTFMNYLRTINIWSNMLAIFFFLS